MSGLKPINVFLNGPAPNPFKVTIILEELGIPYKGITIKDPKDPWFVQNINPNGRLPAIEDPNTGVTLWESGAIIEYLVETYDKEGRLSAADTASKWQLKQYLHFQMSGQGPYYGQAVWFHRCDEDVPLAKKRYIEQTVRVMGVLDDILKDKEYLVGSKLTYADLAFVPWHMVASKTSFLRGPVWEACEVEKKYPNFVAWHERLSELPSVKRAYSV